MKGCITTLASLPWRVIKFFFSCFGCLVAIVICGACVGIPLAAAIGLNGFQAAVIQPIHDMVPDYMEGAIATAADGIVGLAQTAVPAIEAVVAPTVTPFPTPRSFLLIPCSPVEVEVKENGGNLRNGPGTIGTTVFRPLEKGEHFTVIGQVGMQDGSVWVVVELFEGYGYIFINEVTPHNCESLTPAFIATQPR